MGNDNAVRSDGFFSKPYIREREGGMIMISYSVPVVLLASVPVVETGWPTAVLRYGGLVKLSMYCNNNPSIMSPSALASLLQRPAEEEDSDSDHNSYKDKPAYRQPLWLILCEVIAGGILLLLCFGIANA